MHTYIYTHINTYLLTYTNIPYILIYIYTNILIIFQT